MTEETNRALVRRFFDECWNQGDVSRIAELLAPEHVHHLPGWELHGPDDVRQLILALRTAFPDFHATIDDEIVANDKVVVRWTIRGTHNGDFFGMAPTGKRVAYTGIDIVRCADGRIVELWGQPDAAGLQGQLAQS
jgi:steroid delta-isomerase-like uncharacterized protein